jgi:hypothetical protein
MTACDRDTAGQFQLAREAAAAARPAAGWMGTIAERQNAPGGHGWLPTGARCGCGRWKPRLSGNGLSGNGLSGNGLSGNMAARGGEIRLRPGGSRVIHGRVRCAGSPGADVGKGGRAGGRVGVCVGRGGGGMGGACVDFDPISDPVRCIDERDEDLYISYYTSYIHI